MAKNSYLDITDIGVASTYKPSYEQAIRVLEVLKECNETILPDYFRDNHQQVIEILSSWGIAAEVCSSKECGYILRKVVL